VPVPSIVIDPVSGLESETVVLSASATVTATETRSLEPVPVEVTTEVAKTVEVEIESEVFPPTFTPTATVSFYLQAPLLNSFTLSNVYLMCNRTKTVLSSFSTTVLLHMP